VKDEPLQQVALTKGKSMNLKMPNARAHHAVASLERLRRAIFITASLVFAAAPPIAAAAERAYRLAPFSALELNLAARYVVRNGSAASVLIRGRPEILDRIVIEEHDERVRIFVPGVLTDPGQLLIVIDTVGLKELQVKGAGEVEARGFTGRDFLLQLPGAAKIKLDALDVDKFRVEMSGSGSIEASGRASTERVQIGGAGAFHAADLAADSVEVKVQGVGDVEVMAREKLDVRLSGAGTVRYRGEPKLNTQIDGAGSVGRM